MQIQNPAESGKRPHVVIVGAGFGGLAVAHGLRSADVDVTIVDRQNHHLFQPLLYQVATAALSPADIAAPIRTIVRSQRHTHVLLDEVTGVDANTRSLSLATGATLAYDYLVLASGARHSYFGHDDWPNTRRGSRPSTTPPGCARRSCWPWNWPRPIARRTSRAGMNS